MKLISELELRFIKEALEAAKEELDAIDINTDWVQTTGADGAIDSALDLISHIVNSKDA